MTRRTKIVCTLGPATRSREAIRALVDAGMDVARLNFSHGSQQEHAEACALVREASDATGRAVAVLVDLQGPKIRLRRFQGGLAVLEPGATFVMSGEPFEGTSQRASVTYAPLADDVRPGDTLLIDDGLVKLRAVSTDGRDVSCRVVDGGPLSDCKGVNLPGSHLQTPVLTEKDVDDLRFALRMGVDVVALSFVRSARDVLAVRQIMDAEGRRVPVIAKIEKPEAVDDLPAIAQAFDGLMVARGDLGVELSLEQVPVVQKRVAQLGRSRAKPVIVATQMLESMVHNARPTRAEVSDVANAVLDGADALMLAGETSVGDHAVETVATMGRIIEAAEAGGMSDKPPTADASRDPMSPRVEAMAAAAVAIGRIVGARAMVALTQTGRTARHLASHRSPLPLLAFTPDPAVRSQLSLAWGVETFLVAPVIDVEAALAQIDETLIESGRFEPGAPIVVLAGHPGESGSTHTVRVHELASVLSPAR